MQAQTHDGVSIPDVSLAQTLAYARIHHMVYHTARTSCHMACSVVGFEANRIFNKDCISGMKSVPDDIVDLIITDPPFAIDFKASRGNYNRTDSNVLQGYQEIPQKDYYDFTLHWMQECFRILKGSGSMYVFSGWNNLKDILNAIDNVGFELVNQVIWKYQFGVVTKTRYVTSHYNCLFVCKDDSKKKFFPYCRFSKDQRDEKGSLHYRDKEDVWHIKREYWHGKQKTPTKLPAEIIKKILAYSSESGDLVFDPFLGSGQTAIVSKLEGRRYLGFEVVQEYYDFARKRLESGTYLPDSATAG